MASASGDSSTATPKVRPIPAFPSGSAVAQAPMPSLKPPASHATAIGVLPPSWMLVRITARPTQGAAAGSALAPARTIAVRPAAATAVGAVQQQRTQVFTAQAQLATGSGAGLSAGPKVAPSPSHAGATATGQTPLPQVMAKASNAAATGSAPRGLANAVDALDPVRDDPQDQVEISDVSVRPSRVSGSGASGSSSVSGSSVPRVTVVR